MGRPLKETVLKEMGLKAITADGEVTLGKQVGYNKYIVKGADEEAYKENIENRKIVRLTNELVFPEDATMKLIHGDKEEFVLKITKNVFQTETCVHAYELDENGKVKFLEEDVSLENADSSAEQTQETQEGQN